MHSRQYNNRKHHDNRKARYQYNAKHKTNFNDTRHDSKRSDFYHQHAQQPFELTPELAIILQQAFDRKNKSSNIKTAFCIFLITSILLYSVATYSASDNHSTNDNGNSVNPNTNTCKAPPASLYGQPVKQLNHGQVSDCRDYGHAAAVKTCSIFGSKHHMWAIKEKDFFARDHIATLDIKMHQYNEQLMAHIGIAQPDSAIFYEPDGYCESSFFSAGTQRYQAELYYGIKQPNKFVSFHDLPDKARQANITQPVETILREIIGEAGIAKLAVASTFMHHIIDQKKNWGLSDMGLMVLGSDYAPDSIESYSMGLGGIEPGYYSHILTMPERFKENKLYFSIETLKQMEHFYNQLSSIAPPHHITANLFESIRHACEKSCRETALSVQNMSLYSQNEPTHIANDVLREQLKHYLLPIIDAATFKSPLQCH